MSEADSNKNIGFIAGGLGWLVFSLVFVTCLGMWGCPNYSVYHQGLQGQAKLKEAESSRQIAVLEAQAKKDAATMLAAAEIERAKGAAEANRIIGDSLKGNHDYLIYLWIQELSNNNQHVIYVPTEAGLPILEAGRLFKNAPVEEKKK